MNFTEVHSEPIQSSKIEFFTKEIQLLPILVINSILDVWILIYWVPNTPLHYFVGVCLQKFYNTLHTL